MTVALRVRTRRFVCAWHKWHKEKRSPLYRPDWRHAILAQANANLSRALHKMDAADYTPVAVHKDAMYLLSDEPDPIKACPPSVTLGTGLGHFKVQDAAVPLEAVLPAFDGTRGGLGTLLKLLKPLRDRTDAQGGGIACPTWLRTWL